VTDTIKAIIDPRARLPTDARFGLSTRVTLAWTRILHRLLPLGGSSEGNQVTPFFDGDGAYDAMLAAIHSATRRVWLETYIIEPDRVGRLFLEALIDAAKRGVEVVFIFDVVGSQRLTGEQLDPLRRAGVRVVPFNPPFAPLSWFRRRGPSLSLLLRDHRKILLVDDSAGFCGGMNLSEDYAGKKHGNEMFRDTHALVEGPAIRDLAEIFRSSFRTATGDELPLATKVLTPMPSGVFVQVLGSDVRRRKKHIQRALHHTVGRCVHRCFLTSPYFVPPSRLVNQLVRASRRGVDVRLLTAGMSDVPIVAVAATHLYAKLLKGGVKVYEMVDRTLHAKTTTIDGVYAAVGSFNLDRWSFSRNLEVNMTVVDAGLATRLESQFVQDLSLAKEIQLDAHLARGPWDQFLGWLAYQLMRI